MKKRKNGFTLIELLAILVILAILSLVLIPTVKNSIEEAKKDTYNNQVNAINKAAESYFVNSNFSVSENEEKVMYLTDIINQGYIESSKVINPIDESEMSGCVLIKYYSNQYHYSYIDNNTDCKKYTNISE